MENELSTSVELVDQIRFIVDLLIIPLGALLWSYNNQLSTLKIKVAVLQNSEKTFEESLKSIESKLGEMQNDIKHIMSGK